MGRGSGLHVGRAQCQPHVPCTVTGRPTTSYRGESDRCPIDEGILDEKADQGFIDNLTNFWGPSWMGGEYLPDSEPGEVEIARIVLQSTTMDVFSIRARRRPVPI